MKFVNSMLVAAYLLIVGLTAWSLVQNFGIKEVSVEAEVKEILSVEYPGRSETNTTLLCRYSYNSREYEEKVFREGSCRKGDKINFVIDADHPDIVIRFSQKSKVIFLSVMLGIMAVFAIVLLIESFRLKE